MSGDVQALEISCRLRETCLTRRWPWRNVASQPDP